MAPQTDHDCETEAIMWDDQTRRDGDSVIIPATCGVCDYEMEFVYHFDRVTGRYEGM